MLATLLSLMACTQDTELTVIYPELVTSTEQLAFGDVVVREDLVLPIEIINAGRAPLELEEIDLLEGSVFSIEGEIPEQLGQDERVTLELRFTPDTFLEYSDLLQIQTNDPDFEPSLDIPLTGEGVDAPEPDILVEPLSLDFGDVPLGTVGTLWFDVSNTGDADLLIEATEQSGSGAFTIVSDPYGFTLNPSQDTATVIVMYQPVVETGDSGSFVIQSNDPDEASVEVALIGNGGSDADYPVAIIDGPSEVLPLDVVQLSGASSYAPEGHSLEGWEWTLTEQPEGSQTELVDDGKEDASLFIDSAGEYEVQLVVTTEQGISSAAGTWRVDAIPDNRIHVELTWSTGDSDLDLHLLNGPDAQLFDDPDDCCWCNPSANWGSSLSDDDNPSLDLDDLIGYGPENVNIREPDEGEYYIRVHDFEEGGDGVSEATVRIYLDGIKQAEFSQVLERNEVWNAGYIRWPEAVVIEEEGDPYTSASRSCY